MSGRDATPQNQWVWKFIALMMLIFTLVPIWIGRFFPSQNGPEYLLIIQMLKEFENPLFNYSAYYDFFFVLVPNMVFHAGVYILTYLMPILIAYKVMLSLNVILLVSAIFYFFQAIDPRKLIFGFVGFSFAHNYFLTKGYDSYYLALALSFFLMGYVLKHLSTLRWKDALFVGLMFLLVYFTHVFAFLMSAGILILYILIAPPSRKYTLRFIVSVIPAALFFAHYTFFAVSHSGSLVTTEASYWIRYHGIYETIKEYLRMANYSISDVSFYLFLLILLYFFWAVIKKLFMIKSRLPGAKREEGNSIIIILRENRYLAIFICLSIMFFVLPFEIAGWPKFNMRTLPFVLLFLLLTAEPIEQARWRNVFNTVTLVVAVVIGIITINFVKEANRQLEDYVSGIPKVEYDSKILPVEIEEYRIGKIRPLNWSFNYYNLFRGGATGRSLAYITARVPVRYKNSLEEAFPPFSPDSLQPGILMSVREAYDYIVMWGWNEQLAEAFKQVGFRQIHTQNKLYVFENNRLQK